MNLLIESFKAYYKLTDADVLNLQHPELKKSHNGELFRNAEAWIDALHTYKDKKVLIIPDYDSDGIMSGTILKAALYVAGFEDVFCFFPSMATGFGLSEQSLMDALAFVPNPDVIITADNGIMAFDGVKKARELGIDVLVSDHHLGMADEPDATVLVNPNSFYDDSYPFKEICGAQVAYKLMSYYGDKYLSVAEANLIKYLYVFAGIGAVADVMPMVDENRYFVKMTVDRLGRLDDISDNKVNPYMSSFYGLKALMDILYDNGKLNYGVDEGTIGFYISPMLNSSRREKATSKYAFDIFFQDSYVKAYEKAAALYDLNEVRKTKSKTFSKEVVYAYDHFKGTKYEAAIQTGSFGGGYPGLIAGNLVKHASLPTIVFDDSNVIDNKGIFHGSGRAPGWCNLHKLLVEIDKNHPDFFTKWGGHAGAVGVNLRAEYLDDFRFVFGKAVEDLIASLPDDSDDSSDQPRLVFDARIMTPNDAKEFAAYIDTLRPFGHGFVQPQISIVLEPKDVGHYVIESFKQDRHLKVVSDDKWEALFWNYNDRSDLTNLSEDLEYPLVLTGDLGYNDYSGRASLVVNSIR